MKTKRAAIDPVTLTLLGGACLIGIFIPNARPWNWALFKKAPPTQQLKVDLAELEKAKAAQAKAEAALLAAKAEQDAKTQQELRYSQQMAAGAAEALKKVPEPHRTAEVQLASDFVLRINAGLAAAIGQLPIEQQKEMIELVAKSLSQLASERDAAQAALREKDTALQVAIAEKTSLAKQLPALEEKLDKTTTAKEAAELQAKQKTEEVISYAEKITAKEREAGGFKAQANALGRYFMIGGLLYLFIHYVLPSLAQEFPAFKLLGTLNKAVKSIASSHL